MDTICINCPMGCQLHIEEINGEILVRGNTCKRGAEYGKEEYIMPKRTVTTLVSMDNGEVASCKTSAAVPKTEIFNVTEFVSNLIVQSNVKIGDVVEKDILGLGVDLIITGRK